MTSEYGFLSYSHCHELLRATAALAPLLPRQSVVSDPWKGGTRAILGVHYSPALFFCPWATSERFVCSFIASSSHTQRFCFRFPCPALPEAAGAGGSLPPLPAPGAPLLLLELASCSWRCFSCSWSSFPAPGALFLLLGLLPFSWNSFPFPGVLFLLERGSLFKPGFNAALRFVVQHKEGYSWREKGLRGWEQYWVCSCSPSAWKVYRSPKERGGKFFF